MKHVRGGGSKLALVNHVETILDRHDRAKGKQNVESSVNGLGIDGRIRASTL
jgi:hypothetical protein